MTSWPERGAREPTPREVWCWTTRVPPAWCTDVRFHAVHLESENLRGQKTKAKVGQDRCPCSGRRKRRKRQTLESESHNPQMVARSVLLSFDATKIPWFLIVGRGRPKDVARIKNQVGITTGTATQPPKQTRTHTQTANAISRNKRTHNFRS